LSKRFTFGSLLLACATIITTVVFGRLPGDNLFWQELQNSLHSLLFFLFTLLVLQLLRHYPPLAYRSFRRYLFTGSLGLAIALGTETAQWLAGRGFGHVDILRDMAGMLLAIGLYALLERDAHGSPLIPRPGLRSFLIATLCSLLCVAGYPLGKLMLDYHARNQAFPVVLDPAARWADSFINYTDARRLSSACGPGMTSLELLPAPYPGVSVAEPVPDWSSYRQLVITLDSLDSAPFELAIRIHDQLHDQSYTDRYNRTLPVKPGPNRYTIPLTEIRDGPTGRSLRLEAIAGVMLFARDPRQARRICIGNMWLEGRTM
jgi:hypothetical protein